MYRIELSETHRSHDYAVHLYITYYSVQVTIYRYQKPQEQVGTRGRSKECEVVIHSSQRPASYNLSRANRRLSPFSVPCTQVMCLGGRVSGNAGQSVPRTRCIVGKSVRFIHYAFCASVEERVVNEDTDCESAPVSNSYQRYYT